MTYVAWRELSSAAALGKLDGVQQVLRRLAGWYGGLV
jgi:hypothetical protein